MMDYDKLIALATQLGFTDEVEHWTAERDKARAAMTEARDQDGS